MEKKKKKDITKNSKKPKNSKVEFKGVPKPKKSKVKKIVFFLVAVVLIAGAIIFWRDVFPKNALELEGIYNGYIFEEMPPFGLWNVTVKTARGETTLEFYYHPQELEEFYFDKNITQAFMGVYSKRGKVFIGYDVNLSRSGVAAVAGTEISKITGKIYGLETKAGFVDFIGDDSIPIINCSNASSTKFVFEIMLSEKNSVEYSDFCAIIYATSPEDAVKLADLTVYHLLRIMPNRLDVQND
ncbi:MAG: hypothetical protein ACP5N2_04440 [Candidatus Nanoarchaeia archaeon]